MGAVADRALRSGRAARHQAHHGKHSHRRPQHNARKVQQLPAVPAGLAAGGSTVSVEIEGAGGRVSELGYADVAIGNSSLTAGEREAIVNAVRAVRYLHERYGFSGVDAAGTAVHLLLRSSQADERGPFADSTRVSTGSRNPLTPVGSTLPVAGEILPYDVVLHEMTHVMQFTNLGTHWTTLQAQLAEGMADAVSMLATRDWTIGEDYFRNADGSSSKAIREIARGAVRHSGEPVVFDWRKVRDGEVEEHAAGAVLSRTFYEVERRLGHDRAEQLAVALVSDAQSWQGGGSWQQAAAAFGRLGAALWAGDVQASQAIADALAATHLNEALSA